MKRLRLLPLLLFSACGGGGSTSPDGAAGTDADPGGADAPAVDAAPPDGAPDAGPVGPGLLWGRAVQGLGSSSATGAAVDTAGHVIVAGNVRGSLVGFGGPFETTVDGGDDVFVAKYTSSGDRLWSRLFTDRYRLEIHGAAVGPGDDIVIAGYYEDTALFDAETLTGGAGFLVALDRDGAVRWARHLAGIPSGIFLEVAPDAMGGYVVIGDGQGTVTFAGATHELTRGFVARYTAAGEEVWLRPFTGAAIASLAVDDGVTLAGTFFGTADLGGGPVTAIDNVDAWAGRYRLDGSYDWSITIRAEGWQEAHAVENDPATGDVFLAGSYNGAVDFGDGVEHTSLTGQDLFLVRYGATTRTPVWVRSHFNVVPRDLLSRASGGVAVGGELTGNADLGGGTLEHIGFGSDIFLAAWDDSGAPAGSIRYGDDGSDSLTALARAPDDGLVAAGLFEDSLDLGFATITASFGNGSPGFVASLGPAPWDGAGRVPGPADAGVPDAGADASGATHTLAVAFAGSGGGTIAASAPGLTCTASGCTGSFPAEARLELEATAVPPARFSGWGGACRGLGACVLSMTADRSVQAGFSIPSSRAFGAALADGGTGLARDGAGAVVLTGTFGGSAGFGGAPLTAVEAYDGFIARYDAGGAHLWSRRIGHSSPGYQVNQIRPAANAAGDLAVSGGFDGTLDLGGGAVTGPSGSLFVARLGADGGHVWSRAIAPVSGALSPVAVHIDSAGVVIVELVLFGTIDLGGGPISSTEWPTIVVAYADGAGPPLWWRVFSGLHGVATGLDPSDELTVWGWFYGTLDLGGPPLAASAYAIATARYDSADGTHLWSRRVADGYASAYSLASRGGRIAVAGRLDGGLAFGADFVGYPGEFVAVLDAMDGAALWARKLVASEHAPRVSLADDLDVWVGGQFTGLGWFGGELFMSAGTSLPDVYLASFSPAGDALWSAAFAGPGGYLHDLEATGPLDGVFVTGFFGGTVDLGSGPLISAGDNDVFFARVAP